MFNNKEKKDDKERKYINYNPFKSDISSLGLLYLNNYDILLISIRFNYIRINVSK